MTITYQGDNYFKIQSGNITILIDPTNQRSFRGANLIINTIKPALVLPPEEPETIWIDHQGEYETKGAQVRGWSAGQEKDKEKSIFLLEFDDLKAVILGSADKPLMAEAKEKITGADIVLGPAVKNAKWIKELEPAIIIPALKETDLKTFLAEIGHKNYKTEEKLTIKKKDVQPGKTEIIWLKS